MILYGLVLVLHVLVALFLIVVILIQGGRGGLGEAMGGAAAQSLFGGGANTVMAKVTSVVAALFVVTCLSLAALSTARGRSVMEQLPLTADQLPISAPPPQAEAPPPAEQPSAPPAASPATASQTGPPQ